MIERLIERTLIGARWLLAPLYLGLAVLLLLFIAQFFHELFEAVVDVFRAPQGHLIIASLGLVDLVLVAGLVVMVMLSSYENYVSRLEIAKVSAQLAWLAKLDAGSIKVKVMVAIVTISAIDLLQAFLEIDEIPNDKLLWRVVVLLTFVASAIALAVLDQLTAKKHDS
jgi:uncharacterized protein (TIGR00645 family)